MHHYDHTVRFGDISVGGLMHHDKVLDLCIRTLEEVCSGFEVRLIDIVDADGVPYAPVDVRGKFWSYPAIDRPIRVTPRLLDVDGKHFRLQYDFASEWATYGRVRMSHVTVSPAGGAGDLAPADQAHLEENVDRLDETQPELPGFEAQEATGAEFSQQVTYHSPYIEAAGLGYIEDYFGFMASTLESHLAAAGVPLSCLDVDAPMVPVGWAAEFPRPIRFGDTIRVDAAVTDISTDDVTVQYAHLGDDEDDVRLTAELRYECWDDGETVRLPDPVADALAN
jgi:acyl-CoA thioesterase FadM